MTTISAAPQATDQLLRLWQKRAGFVGWFAAVNHKDVGRRYIATGFIYFLLAGVAALLMRLQLAFPDNTFLNAEQYNQLFSTHGTTMMFLFAVPIMQGVGLYFVPLMIGSRDVAFPRMNAMGYYVFLIAGIVIWVSLFVGRAPNGGWFAYVPLTESRYSPDRGIDIWSAVVTMTELSALIAATELIVTIFRMRAPGMSLNRIPLFVWAILVTSFMIAFAMPSVMVGSTLITLDRSIGTQFFNSDRGGDPILWQHLFWFFGHPEVYIIFIPALGIVSEVLATFSRRPVVGYPFLVLSIVAIGIISFGLWVHHMFAVGLPHVGLSLFSAASTMIAIPSGIQIFSALATLWLGKLNFKTPLLYVLGFIFTFVIGGLTGVMLASVPLDWQVHDTYFVVAHFHYVLIGGAVFPLLAGFYYWFPKVTGKLLDEGLGKLNFWLTIIGFNVAFFPMHISGLLGMPRRVYTYHAGLGWDGLNLISTLGALILGTGILLLLINVIRTLRSGQPAGNNPWGAGTLEWATTSPPQRYNFEPLPAVHSRQPLWEPVGERGSYHFASFMERRETLGTTGFEAIPEMRIPLPTNTYIPFLAGIAACVIIGSLVFSLTLFTIGCILLGILLWIWHWPTPRMRDMAWVKAGPDGALPSATVVRGTPEHKDMYPPFYYGVLLLIAIEAAEFMVLFTSYFYLRASNDIWPPSGVEKPGLLLPTLSLIVLLVSCIPTTIADKAILKGNVKGMRQGYLIGLILGLVYVVLQVVYYLNLPHTWHDNAYLSLFWTIGGFHLLFVVALLGETVWVLVLAYQGYFNQERNSAVQADGLNWYFSVALFVLVYVIIYLSPYFL